MSQKFNKQERLTGIRAINGLFTAGKAFTEYPFRVVVLRSHHNGPFPAKILISVSKKIHKRAVDRNLIKRRIREAYRKNKMNFYENMNLAGKRIIFGLVYIGRDIMEYQRIEQKIILILQRLIAEGE